MSDVVDYAASPVDGETNGSRWGWAAYLGASWTWCIGMFLPVLLIRDYGPWAWVIFAVPNVVGAAAMGWVMRSSAMSRQYTTRHASACRLFSFVTIAFQLYFALWMLPKLAGPIGYVAAAVIAQAAFTPITRSRWLRAGGAGALALSAVLALLLLRNGTLVWPRQQGRLIFDAGSVAGLSFVCFAGFLTCPYLDLTFHRARAATTPADAKIAFGVGFGALFAAMIVLTFFYAHAVGFLMHEDDGLFDRKTAMLLAAHLFLQMTYTVNVHAVELARQAATRDDRGTMQAGLGAWLAAALATGVCVIFAGNHGLAYHGRSFGEAGYRVLMSCYGLLFPAYVLLGLGGRRVSTTAWLAVAAAASPFFWLAFLEARMPWAIAGVAVLVVGARIGRTRESSRGEVA